MAIKYFKFLSECPKLIVYLTIGLISLSSHYAAATVTVDDLDNIDWSSLSFTEEWLAPMALSSNKNTTSSGSDSYFWKILPRFKSGSPWIEKVDDTLVIHDMFYGLFDITLGSLANKTATNSVTCIPVGLTQVSSSSSYTLTVQCNEPFDDYYVCLTFSYQIPFVITRDDDTGVISMARNMSTFKLSFQDKDGNAVSYKNLGTKYFPMDLYDIRLKSYIVNGYATDNVISYEFTDSDKNYFTRSNRKYNINSSYNSSGILLTNFGNYGRAYLCSFNTSSSKNTSSSFYLSAKNTTDVYLKYDVEKGTATISNYKVGMRFDYYTSGSSYLLTTLCDSHYVQPCAISGSSSAESTITGTVEPSGFIVQSEDGNLWTDNDESDVKIISTQYKFVFDKFYYLGLCLSNSAVKSVLEQINDLTMYIQRDENENVTETVIAKPEVLIRNFGHSNINGDESGIYIQGEIAVDNLDNIDHFNLYLVPGEHMNSTDSEYNNTYSGCNNSILLNQEKFYSNFAPSSVRRRVLSASKADELNTKTTFNIVVTDSDLEENGITGYKNEKYFTLYVQTIYKSDSEDEQYTFGGLTKLTPEMITTDVSETAIAAPDFKVSGQTLFVTFKDASSDTEYQIYNMLGAQVYNGSATSLPLPSGHYIIKFPNTAPRHLFIR